MSVFAICIHLSTENAFYDFSPRGKKKLWVYKEDQILVSGNNPMIRSSTGCVDKMKFTTPSK